MLTRVLREHLAPSKRLLGLIVVWQTVQTTAALSLPTINARIIDNGVLRGDVGYIWAWGAIMLAVAVVQVVFSIVAGYHGGMVAMRFGRDLRGRMFHQVTIGRAHV